MHVETRDRLYVKYIQIRSTSRPLRVRFSVVSFRRVRRLKFAVASQKGAIDITSPRSFFLLKTIKVKGKREEKKKNKGRHKIESVCSIAPALSLR